MTDWIVSNAWWFAPALTFAGVGLFVGALLWPRKVRVVISGAMIPSHEEQIQKVSELIGALNRRGKHLRSTWPPPPIE